MKFNISFLDFLFNLLIVFVVIAIIAVLHMNPPVNKSDAPKKAEFIITVEWTNNSDNDVDVWLMSDKKENTTPLHYRSKRLPPLYLDHDDTGKKNDTFITVDGKEQTVEINREVITSRGWPKEGEYYLNLHLYSKRSLDIDDVVVVSIIELNPYRLVYSNKVVLKKLWEEKDLVSFRIEDKKIVDVTNDHGYFYVRKILKVSQHAREAL